MVLLILLGVRKLVALLDVVQNVLVLLLHLKRHVTLRRHNDVFARDTLRGE